jgi:hypothetical protein
MDYELSISGSLHDTYIVIYLFIRWFIYLRRFHYLKLCTIEHDFTSLFVIIIYPSIFQAVARMNYSFQC